MEQRVQVSRLDHQHGLLLIDHALVHKIAGNLQGRLCRTLSVAGLQHVQMLVLDRELHVLHILVMVLKGPADSGKLIIDLRHQLLQPVDLLRRPDACDNILALRIQEELTHQALLAGRRVPREGDARPGRIAHVSEGHHLDIDSCSPGVRDIIVPSVHVRARIVP